MSEQPTHRYEFGDFRLDAGRRVLLRCGEPVPLTAKVFDTLLVLVESGGRVLEKEELMRRLWPDSFVEEANLNVNISALRKALGESPQDRRYILTVPGRGYRFAADVSRADAAEVEAAEEGANEGKLSEPSLAPRAARTTPARRARPGALSWRRLGLPLLAAALALSGWGAALYFSLRSQPAQPTPASVKTIAVLPFKPLGQSEDDQLLGLGMADALITRLGNVGPVVVRPTSAVRKYTSLDQDPAAVGRELKVESVLEGSVQRAGDRVRVTVQLVGVQGGAPLWSGKFDEQFTDIFAVQDAISEHVAEALTLQLTGEERGRLNKRYTENTEAYVLYLKGRYYWNKRTREGTTKSLEFYDRAISLDPNFALAYAGLADSYYGLSDQYLPPQEVMPKARAAAQKALEIDNDLAEAHVSLGVVLMYYDWDWAGAEKEFTQAVRLNPRYALAHHHYKSFLMRMGRQEEAAREAALAHELDPTSLVIAANLGLPYYYGRDYDKALDYFRAASDMDPNFYFAHLFQGWAYEQKGQFAEAVQEFETCRRLDDSPIIIGSLAHAYAVSGRRAEARALLSELQRTESGRFVDPYYLAVVYAGLGEREQAFEQLDRAYRARDETLTWLKIDPRLDPLRADPRFADLLQSLRL